MYSANRHRRSGTGPAKTPHALYGYYFSSHDLPVRAQLPVTETMSGTMIVRIGTRGLATVTIGYVVFGRSRL